MQIEPIELVKKSENSNLSDSSSRQGIIKGDFYGKLNINDKYFLINLTNFSKSLNQYVKLLDGKIYFLFYSC